MIKSFMTKMSFWKANTLQAFLFGLWHIAWTIKQFTLGETDFGGMVINSLLYTIVSFVMGFIMGYMYFKTGNLWTSIIWHMIWNCTMNLLIIKSVVYPDDSAVMSNSFTVFWIVFLAYSVISLFISKIFLNKRHIQPVSF